MKIGQAEPRVIVFSSLPGPEKVYDALKRTSNEKDALKRTCDEIVASDSSSCRNAQGEGEEYRGSKKSPVRWVSARREVCVQAQQRNVIKHLGFSPHDTLVWVVGTDSASSASSNEDCDKKGFIRSVLFSPWDLPFLMTGHGASKHLSQIEPAAFELLFSSPALPSVSLNEENKGKKTFPPTEKDHGPNTMPFVANLRPGHALVVPAGWFLQLSVPEGGGGDIWVLESEAACRAAKFRPTLMHLHSKPKHAADMSDCSQEPSEYCRFLKSKRTRPALPQNNSPHDNSPSASSSADETKSAENLPNKCGKRQRGGEAAVQTHGAKEAEEVGGRKGKGEKKEQGGCQWLEKGWSRNLDIHQDWFSHNIPSWQRLFAAKGWLRRCECCVQLQDAGHDSTDITRRVSGGGEGGRRSGGGEMEVQELEEEESVLGERGLRVLELGSWEGNSACWLTSHVCFRKGDELVCVDSFAGGDEHQTCAVYARDLSQIEGRCRANLALAASAGGGRGHVRVLKQPARLFDLIYIDASHDCQDVLQDALLGWPLLKGRGFIIFDDYLWHHVDCPHFSAEAAELAVVGELIDTDADTGSACGGTAREMGGCVSTVRTKRDKKCRCPGRAVDLFVRTFEDELKVVAVSYQVIIEKLLRTATK